MHKLDPSSLICKCGATRQQLDDHLVSTSCPVSTQDVSISWDICEQRITISCGGHDISITRQFLEEAKASDIQGHIALPDVNAVWQKCQQMISTHRSHEVRWDDIACAWVEVPQTVASSIIAGFQALDRDASKSLDPKLIERIARAMCKADGNDPNALGHSMQMPRHNGLAQRMYAAVNPSACEPVWLCYARAAETAILELEAAAWEPVRRAWATEVHRWDAVASKSRVREYKSAAALDAILNSGEARQAIVMPDGRVVQATDGRGIMTKEGFEASRRKDGGF